ncbi:DUF6266 family protein [Pedobacter hartonius]|uniref:Uncharacterized protein n=1 Tax=Pedobacter hartonius TaxID=425514 RepID=A0A1H4FP31_9SPHI|nr:DUF6266 family protein [Pedobacter hartonius]SEA99076.1 hypothetical protein SAMN05443550_10844 [Pedobacter hartonius]
MATANINSFDGFIGRLGDTVTYIRLGKVVKRKIGKSTKPATELQLKYRQKVKVANKLIEPVREFIKVGFEAGAKLARKTPHDLMLSYTLLNAVKGEYPNQEIDFTKVLFSQGKMQATSDLKAEQNDDGLKFTWNTTLIPNQFRADDQVMILVYFPELQSADFVIYAGNRGSGKAQFSILKNNKPTVMETHITFISSDHKRVSDSAYTGQFILPASDRARVSF